MKTGNGTGAIRRLDDLFKWLLAPTSFLMLISWNYLNYLVATVSSNPQLAKIINWQFQEADLLLAARTLITEVTLWFNPRTPVESLDLTRFSG
jgi:hypothetical protein